MTRPLFVHFPFHDRGTVHPANQGSAGERSPDWIRSVRRARRRTTTKAPFWVCRRPRGRRRSVPS